MPNDKTVQISAAGGTLAVSDNNPHVSKGAGNQVLWTSNIAGKTCTVTFANSPFNKSSFSVDTTGSTPSGPAKSTGTFKYSVSCPGFATLDPNVVVDP